MAALVPYKRPVVLSLGELQRYPTTTDRYAITLPFNADDSIRNCLNCSCSLWDDDDVCKGCDRSRSFAKRKAKAIKQTEKRWAWFSEARRMDDSLGTRLGTLGFLPLEIRYKIRAAVIEVIEEDKDTFRTYQDEYHYWRTARCRAYAFGTLELVASHCHTCWLDIFDLNSYEFRSIETCKVSAMGLRLASAQAKIELENTFIFTNAFSFQCPKHLDHFLSHLSAYQKSLLQSITITLFGCWQCLRSVEWVHFLPSFVNSSYRVWIAIIERLPATLKSIKFELGCHGPVLDHHPFPYEQSRGPRSIERANMAVELLGLMTKKIQRQLPGVSISIIDLDELFEEDRESLQAMLDEISPYSKDFMRWWDESRKNAVDGGQGH